MCVRARVCARQLFLPRGGTRCRGGRGEGMGDQGYRVTHSFLPPPFACVCVHVSHRRVYVKGGCFENHGGARGGGKRGSYMPLSAFIRGLHALTLRCHALSPSTTLLSLSLFRCRLPALACTPVDIPLPKSHVPPPPRDIITSVTVAPRAYTLRILARYIPTEMTEVVSRSVSSAL